MRVTVIGSGYVGLVSGACLSELGHRVICVDKDINKIDSLRSGSIPIYEPELDDYVARNVTAGRLSFQTEISATAADIFLIAVGTPPRSQDHSADLSAVYAAATDIAAVAEAPGVVVTKSTVPVGTGDAIERILRTNAPDIALEVVSNPEFLREGNAIQDFMTPDRIVVGTENPFARKIMAELYKPLVERNAPLIFTKRRTSELIKYASNAFLATKISFINEIADLCEAVGADIKEVSHGVGMDRRIGRAFLDAGPGYGGSCFPKDSTALLVTAQHHAVNLRLVESTIAANDARKRAMARRITNAMHGLVQGKTIAILGLTFKPNTDDLRDAPALSIISALQHAGAKIKVYDPVGMNGARHYLTNVIYAQDAYDCATGADCIVLVTEWNEFRSLDASRLAKLVNAPIVVDLRNAIDTIAFEASNFVVHAIGRSLPVLPNVQPQSVRTANVRNRIKDSLTRAAKRAKGINVPDVGLSPEAVINNKPA